jgi:hypothetical protein
MAKNKYEVLLHEKPKQLTRHGEIHRPANNAEIEMAYRIADLEAKLSRVKELVNEQADDDALWCVAGTAFEAYLQQELRRLHSVIEDGE